MSRMPFFAFALVLSAGVYAQDNAAPTPPPAFAPAQPPPDMDAPGTSPASAPPARASKGSASRGATPASVPNQASPPPRPQASAPGDGPVAGGMPELPVVTVRKEGTDTVEEYRRNGKIFMVRIMPTEGPAHFYLDRTGTGRLDRDPLDNTPGPINPVYFKIYDWK